MYMFPLVILIACENAFGLFLLYHISFLHFLDFFISFHFF